MKSLTILIIGLLPAVLWGQSLQREVVASSGTSTVTTASVRASQTIGQTVVGSYDGPSMIVSAGYQQGDGVATDMPEALDLADIGVYPNPVADLLHVNVASDKALQLELRMVDIRGRMTAVPPATLRVTGQVATTLDCSQLAAGSYLLIIRDAATGGTSTYKVQKVD